jgi:hypothetical protein
VRRITGPATQGFHRIAWDLRLPSNTPTVVSPPTSMSLWEFPAVGPLVAPGSYSVSIAKVINGSVVEMSAPQSFEVVALDNASLPVADREDILAFQQQVEELRREALITDANVSEVEQRLPFIKQAILETPGADPGMLARARQIELRLADIQKLLSGDRTRARYWELTVPSVLSRINDVVGARNNWATTYGPTTTHRQSFEIAAREFTVLRGQLRSLIDTELRQLEADMEAAGVPWTPGRGIPDLDS